MSRRRIARLVAGTAATGVILGVLTLVQPVAYAASQTDFELPFPCNQLWNGDTYSGHGAYALDMNQGAGSDDLGKPVVASAAGTVTYVGGGYGSVYISHGSGWSSRYLHMSGFSVSEGQSVVQGQKIGEVDDVGSPGAVHLHYEQRLNGVAKHIMFHGSLIDYVIDDGGNGPLFRSYNCGGGETTMDVNGDGYGDILAVNSAAELMFYRNTLPSTGNVTFAKSKVGQGWSGFNRIVNDDFNGDGYADILATKTNGELWYFANKGVSGLPAFNSAEFVGGGWGSVVKITAGDVTGDGFSDLLGTKADGSLWMWRNAQAATDVGFNPAQPIGTGFGGFTTLQAGDFSGDGSADLVGITSAGDLQYYANNSGSNPGGLPFRYGTRIGGGWQAYSSVRSVDITGDHRADLIAVRPDGGLWYFGNRATAPLSFKKGVQVGNGWTGTRIVG